MTFNQRVAGEARNPRNPLLERICKEILPAYLADNREARVLGLNGQYTHLRRVRDRKRFSVQEHLMGTAHGFVNESGESRERQPQVAYAKGEPGTVLSEPA